MPKIIADSIDQLISIEMRYAAELPRGVIRPLYEAARDVLANPAPWTIAAMFVVMGALVRTGTLEWFTQAAEARAETLAGELASTEDLVATLTAQRDAIVAKTGVSLDQVMAQPDIAGAVISVKNDPAPGLVAINKGANDGVLRGTTFEIFQGKVYKGQVRVEFVHPTFSSAVIVRTTDGSTISQGDNAVTNL